jgi:hypothetical protein
MTQFETLIPRWAGETCFVAGSGASLTEEVANVCSCYRSIAVNDAHRRLPFADVLYGCDAEWWNYYKGVPGFKGEKWSAHCSSMSPKLECAARHNLRLVRATQAHGFSLRPDLIHFGSNSGFQAINMAILWGATKIVLVGFDMKGTHFFGEHPMALVNTGTMWPFLLVYFDTAPAPPGVQILNATPGSALTKYPSVDIKEFMGCPALCA